MKRTKGLEKLGGAVQMPATTISNLNTSAASNSTPNKSKLVFGLGSKTNRLKHDEYAERRQSSNSPIESPETKQTTIINREKSPLRRRRSIERENSSQVKAATVIDAASSRGTKEAKQQERPQQQIRASKYGNFYKPLDLTESSKQQYPHTPAASKPIESKSSDLSSIEDGAAISSRVDSVESRTKQRSQSPARPAKTTTNQQVSGVSDATDKKLTVLSRTKEVQPSAGAQMKEASSLPSPTKAGNTMTSKQTSSPAPLATDLAAAADESNKKQVSSSRIQFSIPPPPQLSSLPGKGSVVSYAKSRIYDKPARQSILFNGSGASLLDSGSIPASISSGFKPPKQVNVTKARERWEGGEPFAKCKSRQRLARQAGKRLIPGVWSMSSVVATQQMQLQQVMSTSNQSANSGLNRSTEPSVKILTRGSVLERVQQFERVPSSASSSGDSSSNSSDSSSSSSSPSSPSSPASELIDDLLLSNRTLASRAVPTEASLASSQPLTPAELRTDSTNSVPSSKQALYKSRVSSIQVSNDTPIIFSPSNSPKSPQSPPITINRQRYGIVRRRSSAANNSAQLIPKFYHPFGKPNTYEIELQKKNIVSCFDKFPDRMASLVAPNYKRHFHSIALACGFSEYFKEPLYLYVKHQMTQSNLLHSPTSRAAARYHRPSGLGFDMANGKVAADISRTSKNTTNSDASSANKRLPLVRAASIDNSTMEKIQNQTTISCEQFLVCWRELIATAFDNPARFVHLLTLGQRNYLLPDDFVPIVQSIIQDHPGLEFLRAAPDFHMRYIQTVIARIYFNINKSWTGKINLTELRQSNLLAVLQVLSQEEDINQVTDYFSYEHFYVIYCKFWSLDQDHDLLISKEDLARHNDAAISSRIIERIFMGTVSRQIKKIGKMSYSDFVWFLIAEEDKKHPRSIEYWFRLMDIDGDGYISMYEMEYFYYEQMKRLELMNIEALPFIDSACQILDLVNPKEKNKISLADLKRSRMATIFFDTFINLEKYLEHESREFVSTRDVVQDGMVISDWDRYASEEYESLVSEETTV